MSTHRHPGSVYRQIVKILDEGRHCALATVLSAEGSVPQVPGAKAVIDETGAIWGTVGGGVVEAEARKRAVEACSSRLANVFDQHMHNAYSRSSEAICGGHMRVLIDPVAAENIAFWVRVAQAVEERERGVLLTAIRAREQTEVSTLWLSEAALCDMPGGPSATAMRGCLDNESTALFTIADAAETSVVEVLVDPVLPAPRLLIVGAGHVGRALARAGVEIGFEVIVLDDRPEYADPALLPPEATVLCNDIPREMASYPFAEDVYVVIVTRGHQCDAEALEACIHKPTAYVGMIGSKRKIALIRKNFVDSGLATSQQFDAVHAPVGLEIGAVTVPEIATSIAAQLIAVRRQSAAPGAPKSLGQP